MNETSASADSDSSAAPEKLRIMTDYDTVGEMQPFGGREGGRQF